MIFRAPKQQGIFETEQLHTLQKIFFCARKWPEVSTICPRSKQKYQH